LGYALIQDSVQVIGLAAPIFKQGTIVASLSIFIPAFRFDDKIKKKMIKLGLESAKRISRNLG
jgi:DNA-binding IclR family transcriptional regulator